MAETAEPQSLATRFARLFLPSREHSVLSAAVLLMVATMLSRVVGALRETYVAWAFGAGPTTDAYVAAFTLPDLLNYMASGGAISISFIAIYTRYIAEQREEEASHAFSVIVSVMSVGFVVLVAIAELFTPQFVRWWFHGFTAEQQELCIRLTRILLPAQLFFLVGGVVAAVQQTRRQFLIPAFAPIIYTVFIIAGGVLLSGQMGIASLAVGALAGSFAGPFLANAFGAAKTGIGFKFRFAPTDPAFTEWLAKSVPLMLGVSVIVADDWIMRYFASSNAGAIAHINYAKRLLLVPVGILGQAVGVASLPFFARLHTEKKLDQFAATVNNSITKLACLSLLASSWMIVSGLFIVDLAFRRGQFTMYDTLNTSIYFTWFCLALVFWSVQGLYARAFYAAGQMIKPMVAATLVTLATIPVYRQMYGDGWVPGLAIASNLAIFLHTLVLAVILSSAGLVPIRQLGWREILKTLLVGTVAAGISFRIRLDAFGPVFELRNFEGHLWIALNLAAVSLTWLAATLAGLWLTRSELLKLLRR